MSVAVMRCCATAPILGAYEAATDSLLARLGIPRVEVDFNCCGYPLRNERLDAWVFSSARNLALAERAGADLVTVCACCYGSTKQADRLLRTDEGLRASANEAIAGERLRFAGSANVRHLLHVLRDDVGLARIRAERKRSFEGLRVACHYGCHLLRPGDVVDLDDAKAPTVMEDLVAATGAEPIGWTARLDCCGAPVWGVNDALSEDLTARKLRNAREAGADALCVVCPWCFIQLDRVRRALRDGQGTEPLPVILVHQLVGLALGVDAAALGLPAGWAPPARGEPLARSAP